MPNGTWRNEPFFNDANINSNLGGSNVKSSSSSGLYHAIESAGQMQEVKEKETTVAVYRISVVCVVHFSLV